MANTELASTYFQTTFQTTAAAIILTQLLDYNGFRPCVVADF